MQTGNDGARMAQTLNGFAEKVRVEPQVDAWPPCGNTRTMTRTVRALTGWHESSAVERAQPVSTFFPAFFQPAIPAGITNTFS